MKSGQFAYKVTASTVCLSAARLHDLCLLRPQVTKRTQDSTTGGEQGRSVLSRSLKRLDFQMTEILEEPKDSLHVAVDSFIV